MQNGMPATDRESWLRTIDEGLTVEPELLPLLLERAIALEGLGRDEEAEATYRNVFERDPQNFPALNNLARLLYKSGRRIDAFHLYKEAVARHPENDMAHANFGYMLLRGEDAASARLHYERALKIAPENIEAHRGLALALKTLGETTSAAEHHALGFDKNPLTVLPYRGAGEGIRTLMIISSTSGNIHFEPLLNDQLFAVTKIVAESEEHVAVLPPHDLLINAIGDADVAAKGLAAAHRIIRRSDALVINHPHDVEATRRIEIAQRLRSIPNVRTPQMHLFDRESLLNRDGASTMKKAGFEFPLLVRSLGFHTGHNFIFIEQEADLQNAIKALPGAELLAIEFIDTRNLIGEFCKYRVIMVDGEIYPLHAATSSDWKVHYFSAQMDDEIHCKIDQEFIENMDSCIGSRAVCTLMDISDELGLDYGGIDFTIDEDGQVVVFEANATMVIPQPPDEERFSYRIGPTKRICGAVEDLFRSRITLKTINV